MGTPNTLVVDDPRVLPEAVALAREEIEEIEEACSRFRPSSDLTRLNAEGGSVEVALSPLLEAALVAAFQTAEMTGGLVDPTVGRCVEEIGYTVTFRDLPPEGPPLRGRVRRVLGWRSLAYDPEAHTLRLPEGVALDLGASCKAWAADRVAAAVAERFGVSVAMDCGGDVAVCGPGPEGGWPIRVASAVGALDGQDVLVYDGGLATSGTTARRWRRGDVLLHHIIDPATGMPADTPWAMVTVAAATCLEANAAATAAIIMGARATAWLDELGLPARLVDTAGAVSYAGGWRS